MNNNPILGIPPEVCVYHPVEFLELSKVLNAFLDLGLESFKGGVGHQLLVAHVVRFVQENSLQSFAKLPRFKSEYLTELIQKCQRKGIFLEQLSKKPLLVNNERVSKLADAVSAYQSQDLFDQGANLFVSSNYSMFHFLEFNRIPVMSHVHNIKKSILENGILSYPLIIYTDCIDGTMKYWILDGQHRFLAFKILGLPIRFTLYQKQKPGPVTLPDIVRLVARVNNTSRRWGIRDYLNAWKSIHVREYEKIFEVYERTKIPITSLLQAYSGKNRKRAVYLFMDGIYSMSDESNGELYVRYLEDLKPVTPKSTIFHSALLDMFRSTPQYDNEKMIKSLLKIQGKYVFADKQEGLVEDLKKLYQLV